MTVHEGASNLQLLEEAGSFLLKLTKPPPAIQQQPLGICAHKKETFIWAKDSHRVRSSSIHHSLRLETTQMFTRRTGDRPRLCASVPQNHKSSARGQAVPLAVAWAKLTDTEGTDTSPLHEDQRSWLCGGGGVTVGHRREFSEMPGMVDTVMASWVRAAVRLHQAIHLGFVHFPVCKL